VSRGYGFNAAEPPTQPPGPSHDETYPRISVEMVAIAMERAGLAPQPANAEDWHRNLTAAAALIAREGGREKAVLAIRAKRQPEAKPLSFELRPGIQVRFGIAEERCE
jgi:hypothetical protein